MGTLTISSDLVGETGNSGNSGNSGENVEREYEAYMNRSLGGQSKSYIPESVLPIIEEELSQAKKKVESLDCRQSPELLDARKTGDKTKLKLLNREQAEAQEEVHVHVPHLGRKALILNLSFNWRFSDLGRKANKQRNNGLNLFRVLDLLRMQQKRLLRAQQIQKRVSCKLN